MRGHGDSITTKTVGHFQRQAIVERRRAAVSAEMRRLERQLLAVGPMPRAALAQGSTARRWRAGTFEEAVREGIRLGGISPLPLGWLEARAAPRGERHA